MTAGVFQFYSHDQVSPETLHIPCFKKQCFNDYLGKIPGSSITVLGGFDYENAKSDHSQLQFLVKGPIPVFH